MKIFHKFNLIIIMIIATVISAYSFYNIRSERQSMINEMIEQATYFAKTVALGINSTSVLDRRDLLVEQLDQMIPNSHGWIVYAAVTNMDNYAWINTNAE